MAPPQQPSYHAHGRRRRTVSLGCGAVVIGTLVVLAIVVTVVVLIAWPDPEVGDCLRDNKGGLRTKIVDCADPAARYEVVRKIPGGDMTEEEAERRVCDGHPGGTPKVFLRRRPRGVDFAVCTIPIRS